MSILREEVHEAVDQLPENELAGILAIVRGYSTTEEPAQRWPLPEFVGMFASGEGDLSEKSADFIRDSLGRDAEK